jgi:ribosome-binding factor A
MLPYKRADRVASLLQKEIAGFLERELRDPRLKKITVTKVALSDDLKLARIYYSLVGTDRERAEAGEGLQRAKGMLKKLIAQNTYLRSTPDLEFYYDQGLEYSQRVDDLIKKIHEQNGPDTEDHSRD